MDKLIICGPTKLKGEVIVSAAKNSSLPILASTILVDGRVKLDNLPNLSDISFFKKILITLGMEIHEDLSQTIIDGSTLYHFVADYDLVRKMRASVLVLGPLLSRFGEATVSLPGGCAIGSRPIDIHLKGLRELGAEIEIKNGYIKAKAKKLIGANIALEFPSVGATENLIMASIFAEGITTISNAALEPEIDDLINFLQSLGAEIEGKSSSIIKIKGDPKRKLVQQASPYRPIGDRIEAITFIIAALITKSNLVVRGFDPTYIGGALEVLMKMGAKFSLLSDGVHVFEAHDLTGVKVETSPYPGFPTDAQAQLMALMGKIKGNSVIVEKIFENRFMHVPELIRMGMDIELNGNSAYINGKEKTFGAPIMCTDLRASAALVLSALSSEGESILSRVYHLDRGYEGIEKKLSALGANIHRVL